MQKVEDAYCELEVFDGKRLGNAHKLAVYEIDMNCEHYAGWTDGDGDSCQKYLSENWCEWGEAPSWAANYQSNGADAGDACCGCGGGNPTGVFQIIGGRGCDDLIVSDDARCIYTRGNTYGHNAECQFKT